MSEKIARGIVHFDVFCPTDAPYELSNDVDALQGAGIQILAPKERIALPDALFVCGEDVPTPVEAATRERLSQAALWRSVVAEATFDKDAPDMDYLAGALYTACDIAGEDGLILDRTSGIVVDADKLRALDENTEVRDTVVIEKKSNGGKTTLRTRGLVKYGQREMVADVADDVEDGLCGFLYNNVFPKIVMGGTIFPDETLESVNPPFRLKFVADGDALRALDAPKSGESCSDLSLLEGVIRRATGRG